MRAASQYVTAETFFWRYLAEEAPSEMGEGYPKSHIL